jgi:hypothetical protein
MILVSELGSGCVGGSDLCPWSSGLDEPRYMKEMCCCGENALFSSNSNFQVDWTVDENQPIVIFFMLNWIAE